MQRLKTGVQALKINLIATNEGTKHTVWIVQVLFVSHRLCRIVYSCLDDSASPQRSANWIICCLCRHRPTVAYVLFHKVGPLEFTTREHLRRSRTRRLALFSTLDPVRLSLRGPRG